MTITYNGNTYTVTDDSVFSDFSIEVVSLDEACTIVANFENISEYTFGTNDYTDMIVKKRSIIITDTYTVNVKLRRKTQIEQMQDEIDTLRNAMVDLATTTNKTTTAKINNILKNTTRVDFKGVIE